MCERNWRAWLSSVTGEDSTRGIARKVGRSHTQVQRWIANGVPPSVVAELTTRFHADPIEALVLTGWLDDEHVPHLNYTALVEYIPVQVLAKELSRRAAIYSRTRPDPLRKTRTGHGTGPQPTDVHERPSFRLSTKRP